MILRLLGNVGGVDEAQSSRSPVAPASTLLLWSPRYPLTTFHHSSLLFQVFGSHDSNHELVHSPSSISYKTVNPSLLYHDLRSRVRVKWDFEMEKVRLDVIIPSLRTLYCLSLLSPEACQQILGNLSPQTLSSLLSSWLSHFPKLLT